MKRRTFMQWSLGTLPAWSAAAPRLHWDSRTFNAMGTTMTIRLAHTDQATVVRALDSSVDLMRRLETQMSLFLPDSAISRLNRTGVLPAPEPDVLAVLRTAQRVSHRSAGAFDITVQPLWRVFDAARALGRRPSPDEVAAARALVDWRALRISDRLVQLPDGRSITLNGIAQGYAADRIKTNLSAMGIRHALINSGEWASLGSPGHPGDWTLGVGDPRNPDRLLCRLAMQGRCVATSADDQYHFSADFMDHHIFDPGTGYSPRDVSSVTVLAPTCVMADALTKVFFVAGYARALPLAKSLDVDVLVVNKSGRWQASPGVALQQV